jgi:diaminohydroxyphosphoribosylaminopyrimidine deaminase / 5-amino-6-(5-phosphoribosylamino)uracil reductase
VDNAEDVRWMGRALELAEQGRGYVEPNPLVGAVVVRDGALVGEGWHRRYGGPHAEIHALHAAGEAARGATLYVTLEPCCHHGKTPPCTDAIIRAGVARVVAAMADPFPEVAGQGIARLRAAGIEVAVGVAERVAEFANRPYLTLVTRGRPFVHAKWAMTLDGKIASAGGDSKWVSGEAARARVHELRGRMDAILVGAGTVRSDDPLLTARPPGARTPARVVLSSRGDLPRDCRLLRTLDQAAVIVATLRGFGRDLRSLGCEVIDLPEERGFPSVAALLAELGGRRMTNVLVEGGAQVFGSLVERLLVDEFHVFVAPRILGGAGALSPVGGVGFATLKDSWPLGHLDVEPVGADLYVRGRTTLPPPGG